MKKLCENPKKELNANFVRKIRRKPQTRVQFDLPACFIAAPKQKEYFRSSSSQRKKRGQDGCMLRSELKCGLYGDSSGSSLP